MSDKHRWHDPANDGQVDYVKAGKRFLAIMLLLVLAAIIKIGIRDNWIATFRSITGH